MVVDQTRILRLVRQVTISAGDLSDAAIEKVFAAWQGTDERGHYRLKWDGGVALYGQVEQAGWIHRRHDDSMKELGAIAPALPPWRTELDLLYDAAEQAAEAARAGDASAAACGQDCYPGPARTRPRWRR